MTFKILSLFAGLLYIIVGIFVFRYSFFIIKLDQNIAYGLGSVLVLYGIFRIVRAILQIRNSRNE